MPPPETAPAPKAAPGPAANLADGQLAEQMAEWKRVFDAAASYFAAGRSVPTETELYAELLGDVIAAAESLKQKAAAYVNEQRPLLAALPPPPAADSGEAEAAQVAELRAKLRADIDAALGRVAAADLAIVRAKQLNVEIAGLERQELTTQLNQRQVDTWSIEAFGIGADEVLAALANVIQAPFAWRASLSAEEWGDFKRDALPPLLAMLAGVLGFGVLARSLLLRRYGYHTGGGHITQARRLGAATVRAVADGLIPAGLMAILYFWSGDTFVGLGAPVLADALGGAAIGLAMTLLAHAGLGAALTPQRPLWRLLPVADAAAVAIRRRGVLFAFVAAFDLFLWAALASQAKSAEFMTIYAMIACGVRAAALMPLLRGRLWEFQDEAALPPLTPPADGAAARQRNPLWLFARIGLGFAAVGAVAAAGLGYADLALFVARAMSWTIVVVGGVFLLRGAAREAIQALLNARTVRSWIGVGPEGAETLIFWGHALLEPLFLVAAAVLTAPFWGFSQREMFSRAGDVLSGFQVGSVTISLTAIGLGVLAFVLALAVTRAIQRAMLTRLLPRTRMELGAQHSLTTGFGYLGLLFAIMIGVSTLGIDMSNLAIVAGALSLGIGFGLQSIVNNFVSGLILLIERPIKVGDWIIVGGQQGIVKRIAIRATEFETFERSSVIIPNSDLIANAVTNRTLKDRNGRVDIAVGVAYGTDTYRVERILLELAKAHPETLALPEPFVLFMGFGASSLDFELRLYTGDNLRSLRIASSLRHRIAARLEAEGIEIPFPQRVVHMVPAPDPTVPKDEPPRTTEAEADLSDAKPADEGALSPR